STTFRDEILGTIGASGIVSRPIVIAGGTTYTAALSEMFLSRFERSPGIYVIPPGSLSSLEIDSWRLFAAYDCLVCRQGSPLAVNWSQSPYVLEYRDLSGSGAFDATYALSLVRSWGGPVVVGPRRRGVECLAAGKGKSAGPGHIRRSCPGVERRPPHRLRSRWIRSRGRARRNGGSGTDSDRTCPGRRIRSGWG